MRRNRFDTVVTSQISEDWKQGYYISEFNSFSECIRDSIYADTEKRVIHMKNEKLNKKINLI